MNDKLIIDRGIYNNIDVIENTLESFNEAFKNNYTIKTKIKVLKDNTFVLLEDDATERLLNLRDSIKSFYYEEIDYISKYKVLKIEDFVKEIYNNTVFLEISNYSKKVCNMLLKYIINFEKNIVILSMNINVLKFFRKHGFKVTLKINGKNKRLISSNFKPDSYCIDYGLLDRKKIKKLKEEFYVIANNVAFDELKFALEIYNNVIICT